MPLYETPYGKYFAESEAGRDEFILSEKKRESISVLNVSINGKMKALVSKYPDREAHTWPTAVAESRAIIADLGADAPHVTASAEAAGMTPTELAAIILANADAFAAASGHLVGLRIKIKGLIESATTVEEIDQAMELLG